MDVGAAYALGVPDGPLGSLHHGVTLALAAVGRQPVRGTRARLGRAAGWRGARRRGGRARLPLGDAFKERRACASCLVGAALNLGRVPLLWLEWREARGA